MEIIISENDLDVCKRLDLYLSLHIPEISRSNIKKTIESNKVSLNGEIFYKAGYKVRVGDKIIFPEEDLKIPVISELSKSTFDLEILHEDSDYIFINKPIGLIVHPTNPSQKDTLVNKLLDLNSKLPSNNFLRPGIVHRLDKDTSGVIVVAKNPKSLWWLTGQFANRKVKKEYISLGLNTDAKFQYKKGDTFEYDCFMRRSSRDRKQFTAEVINHKHQTPKTSRYSKSKFVINDVITLRPYTHIVYSTIYPTTGRTHQIRVHQRENSFPILGDEIYLSKKQKYISTSLFTKNNLKDRLYLHAHSVTFENYNGKVYCISAQIPESFHETIKAAKKISDHKT